MPDTLRRGHEGASGSDSEWKPGKRRRRQAGGGDHARARLDGETVLTAPGGREFVKALVYLVYHGPVEKSRGSRTAPGIERATDIITVSLPERSKVLDQGRVNQASAALREMHRGIIYEDKKMWHFVSTGNEFLLSEREVQVAALDKYNRELRNEGSPELQLNPADFANFF